MARAKQRELEVARIKTYVAEWREHRGLSQRALSRLAGVSHNTIRRIEMSESNWNEDTLGRIAQALNTDIPSLLARHPEQTEGIWTVWTGLTDAERRQLVELAIGLKRARRD